MEALGVAARAHLRRLDGRHDRAGAGPPYPARVRTLRLHCTLRTHRRLRTLACGEPLRGARARATARSGRARCCPGSSAGRPCASVPSSSAHAAALAGQPLPHGLDRAPTPGRGDRRATTRWPSAHAARPDPDDAGTEDILVPPAFSRELHARIPGADAGRDRGRRPRPLPRTARRLQRGQPGLPHGSTAGPLTRAARAPRSAPEQADGWRQRSRWALIGARLIPEVGAGIDRRPFTWIS